MTHPSALPAPCETARNSMKLGVGGRRACAAQRPLRDKRHDHVGDHRRSCGTAAAHTASMSKPLLFLAVSCLVACGGTTAHIVPTNTPPHALTPRAPESVEVFTSRAPERPYSDVAYLEIEEKNAYTRANSKRLLNELIRTAAIEGCDGLVVMGEGIRPRASL